MRSLIRRFDLDPLPIEGALVARTFPGDARSRIGRARVVGRHRPLLQRAACTMTPGSTVECFEGGAAAALTAVYPGRAADIERLA